MLDQIKQKITDKGWNLYLFAGQDTIYTAVPRGPAPILEIGRQYAALPSVQDPTSAGQMKCAMEYIYQKERVATILHGGIEIALVTLRIDDKEIVIRGGRDIRLSYEDLLRDLDTLTPTTDAN